MERPLKYLSVLLFFHIFAVQPIWATSGDSVLVLSPKRAEFQEVIRSLKDDVDSTLNIRVLYVSKFTKVSTLDRVYNEVKPKLFVALDNPAIELVRSYRARKPEIASTPLLATMAPYINKFLEGVPLAVGISYEIPAITTFINLRMITTAEIERVGVLYDERLSDYFQEQKTLCESELIELVGYPVKAVKSKLQDAIYDGLSYLIKKEKVDVLWVLNDSNLINESLLQNSWLPALSDFKKPIVVGVANLVKQAHFAHFAVVPDHYALGAQVAGLIYQIEQNDWQLKGSRVIEPLSVKKYLNYKSAKPLFEIRIDRLPEIDYVLE